MRVPLLSVARYRAYGLIAPSRFQERRDVILDGAVSNPYCCGSGRRCGWSAPLQAISGASANWINGSVCVGTVYPVA